MFRLSEYRAFLAENEASITAFQAQRQAAFDEERADWGRNGEFDRLAALTEVAGAGAASGRRRRRGAWRATGAWAAGAAV